MSRILLAATRGFLLARRASEGVALNCRRALTILVPTLRVGTPCRRSRVTINCGAGSSRLSNNVTLGECPARPSRTSTGITGVRRSVEDVVPTRSVGTRGGLVLLFALFIAPQLRAADPYLALPAADKTVRLGIAITVDGQPPAKAHAAFLDRLFDFFERNGEGKLSM